MFVSRTHAIHLLHSTTTTVGLRNVDVEPSRSTSNVRSWHRLPRSSMTILHAVGHGSDDEKCHAPSPRTTELQANLV